MFWICHITFWYFLWKRDPYVLLKKHALMRGYQPPTPTSLLFGRRHERSLAVWQSKAETQRRSADFPSFPRISPLRCSMEISGVHNQNDDLLAGFTCLCFSPINWTFLSLKDGLIFGDGLDLPKPWKIPIWSLKSHEDLGWIITIMVVRPMVIPWISHESCIEQSPSLSH